uniref:Uncharacterized protein n=1 Tax=Setaria digitata TaxID=48799 RepID=A0A915PJW5_9BILA
MEKTEEEFVVLEFRGKSGELLGKGTCRKSQARRSVRPFEWTSQLFFPLTPLPPSPSDPLSTHLPLSTRAAHFPRMSDRSVQGPVVMLHIITHCILSVKQVLLFQFTTASILVPNITERRAIREPGREREMAVTYVAVPQRHRPGSSLGLTAITHSTSTTTSSCITDRMSQKGRLAAGPVALPRGVTAMSSAADDGADEVKVFRRNDADDVETAQSSHQLTEDKKDVALETELETRTPSSSIIGLTFLKALIIHFTIRMQPATINQRNI